MKVSGKTKVIGIFGYPIEHTLSPAMHNAAFEALGLDICYAAFRVEPGNLPEAVNSVRALNMPGVNITIPHKESVMPLLDHVNDEAAFIGAVNTVVNSEGSLTGYNTDGRGFMHSLSEAGISIDGKDIVVIGTGGASRAISYYLSEKASSIALYDVDRAKKVKLANDLLKIRNNIVQMKSIEDIKSPHLIINATPLGLKSDDPLPLNPDSITPEMIVCDLVYKKTALLKEAESKGAGILDGSGMLLWQGVLAFELWTRKKPPVDVMRRTLLSQIS
jgi:shikimate dehydrogenase